MKELCNHETESQRNDNGLVTNALTRDRGSGGISDYFYRSSTRQPRVRTSVQQASKVARADLPPTEWVLLVADGPICLVFQQHVQCRQCPPWPITVIENILLNSIASFAYTSLANCSIDIELVVGIISLHQLTPERLPGTYMHA